MDDSPSLGIVSSSCTSYKTVPVSVCVGLSPPWRPDPLLSDFFAGSFFDACASKLTNDDECTPDDCPLTAASDSFKLFGTGAFEASSLVVVVVVVEFTTGGPSVVAPSSLSRLSRRESARTHDVDIARTSVYSFLYSFVRSSEPARGGATAV